VGLMDRLLLDSWTPMSFKRAMGNDAAPGRSWTAPSWVTGEHQRRLQAYTVLQAYIDNSARHFLASPAEQDQAQHREYGDPALVRSTALSALLGDDQRILTPGAESYQAEEGAEEGAELVENEPEVERAHAVQTWVEDWAEAERFLIKLQEAERDVVGLGDGVYTLGWSSAKGRPRLRVFDPGFYFPVLDDGNEDDFPKRVHVAWELPPEDGDRGKRVRRITWELLPVAEPYSLPWEDDPVTESCFLTDAIWTLNSGKATIDDFTEASAEFMVDEEGNEFNQRDLGIDFIPVVHVSNTISVKEHYGRSALLYVLQILDDIANADTDLSAASSTTGTPPVSISGTTMDNQGLSYGPGTVFNVGDGRMDVLDTSRSLDALMKYVESLLARLSINGRLPAALLGRVDPSEVPSGLALQLSFGPLSSMVREMRMARDEKYSLIFKFAWRLARLAGAEDVPEEWHHTKLEFGSYLPADTASAVAAVGRMLDAGAMSLETAVTVLANAGVPVEDIAEEVRLIQSRDFEGAERLLDAVGSQAEVDSYLGLSPATRDRPEAPLPEPSEEPFEEL